MNEFVLGYHTTRSPTNCSGLWDPVRLLCQPTWDYPNKPNRPRIHNSPPCLHNHGWHDMAGTITTADGTRHFFQGCPDKVGDPLGRGTPLVVPR